MIKPLFWFFSGLLLAICTSAASSTCDLAAGTRQPKIHFLMDSNGLDGRETYWMSLKDGAYRAANEQDMFLIWYDMSENTTLSRSVSKGAIQSGTSFLPADQPPFATHFTRIVNKITASNQVLNHTGFIVSIAHWTSLKTGLNSLARIYPTIAVNSILNSKPSEAAFTPLLGFVGPDNYYTGYKACNKLASQIKTAYPTLAQAKVAVVCSRGYADDGVELRIRGCQSAVSDNNMIVQYINIGSDDATINLNSLSPILSLSSFTVPGLFVPDYLSLHSLTALLKSKVTAALPLPYIKAGQPSFIAAIDPSSSFVSLFNSTNNAPFWVDTEPYLTGYMAVSMLARALIAGRPAVQSLQSSVIVPRVALSYSQDFAARLASWASSNMHWGVQGAYRVDTGPVVRDGSSISDVSMLACMGRSIDPLNAHSVFFCDDPDVFVSKIMKSPINSINGAHHVHVY
jgi:hypothetical protein